MFSRAIFSDNCWATDGAHRKNPATGTWEYFFYLSIGHCQTAVMKSSGSPSGPWVNVLGTPLLNTSLGNSLNPQACFRDPAVFEDDDGSHYIISGVFDYCNSAHTQTNTHTHTH